MTQKFLYLIEYFVPVPFSEGGLLSVIAESDEECFDIVTEWADGKVEDEIDEVTIYPYRVKPPVY